MPVTTLTVQPATLDVRAPGGSSPALAHRMAARAGRPPDTGGAGRTAGQPISGPGHLWGLSGHEAWGCSERIFQDLHSCAARQRSCRAGAADSNGGADTAGDRAV